MGDISNMNDIERLMRSDIGKAHLDEIVRMLKGHTIVEVSFSNETHFIATTLHLDKGGGTFLVFQPSLTIEAIREQFADVLEREYYKDYPERKPLFRARNNWSNAECQIIPSRLVGGGRTLSL